MQNRKKHETKAVEANRNEELPSAGREEPESAAESRESAGEQGDMPGTSPVETPEEPAVEEDPLTVLQRERDELNDRLLRLAAEFDNFRKRSAREWQQQRKKAGMEILREMLELLDNFERALQSSGDDENGFRKGVDLIHQQFVGSLKKFGVETLNAAGEVFDPAKHEAILMVDSDSVEDRRIVDVVQQGYTLHGDILRPARVTVSRGVTAGASQEDKDSQ